MCLKVDPNWVKLGKHVLPLCTLVKNIFYGDLLNDDGTLKSQIELINHFKAKDVNLEKPVITSCGSGVTAAIINLALDRIGKSEHSLYDGSWTEWGMYPTVPVETGDA